MAALDAALLAEMFEYDASNGRLVRKKHTSPRAMIGDVAGSKHSSGYIYISINRKLYKAHRLIWLMVNGYMPKMIDHINGIRDDNRLCNLREVTPAQNARNQKIKSSNKSGVKGVSFHAQTGKWRASDVCHGKQRHLGLFSSIEDAKRVVVEFRNAEYGEYANHG